MGGAIVHVRGKRAEAGDCMYAAAQKDNDMRDQVRTSFERVSEGLLTIGEVCGVTEGSSELGPAGVGCFPPVEHTPVTLVTEPTRRATVPCEHPESMQQLINDRAELIRMVEELVEADIPGHDLRHYRKKVKLIKHGKAVHDFR
jgi:hypothetical protein